MFPKKERLKKTDFSHFFSIGKKYHSLFFTLVHTSHKHTHTAVVVSKKIAHTAVLRNKIRRRLYGMMRNCKKEFQLNGVYILVAKPPVIKNPYKTQKEALYTILKTIHKKP